MLENGEKDLLTARPVIHYATSSGSTGKPKRIPVSDFNVGTFSDYGGSVIFAHLNRQIKKQGKKNGHWCVLVDLNHEQLSENVTLGSISAHLGFNYSDILGEIVTSPAFLQSPEGVIQNAVWLKALFALQQEDLSIIQATFSSAVYEFIRLIETGWEGLVKTIETGTLDSKMSFTDEEKALIQPYLKADPARAAFLRAEFEAGFDKPIIPRIWPNLAMVSCIGGSFFAEYTRRVKHYTGELPIHMAVYGASESMMAIPVDYDNPEYELLSNAVLFEFLEVGDEDYSKTLMLDELEDGKDYEIIVTNLSGFYRYRMFDVIHIEGHDGRVPYGHIVYRLNQVVSMVGEKTNTEQLDYIKDKMAEKLGTGIQGYSIFADYSVTPSRYVIFFEPEKYCGKGQQPQYSEFVDDLFRKVNVSFEKYRHQDTLGMPMIIMLEPETYALYRHMQIRSGISANQLKPVRIINDESKISFFFGLSEGTFETSKRIIFELRRKIDRVEELEAENARLKRQIKALTEKGSN